MPLRSSSWLLLLLMLMIAVVCAACSSGGGIGATCGGNDDCDRTLQCLRDHCEPQCLRAPECGDGYSCDNGICQPASGQLDSACLSEVDCAAGLSCQIKGAELDNNNRPLSTCVAEGSTGTAGSTCTVEHDCRNGTCTLGHCVDLCRQTSDCLAGTSCVTIPSELGNNAMFMGCLLTEGVMSWSIPVSSPAAEILLPVPDVTRSAELVMSVDDPGQKVGAASVLSPGGIRIYSLPCSPLLPNEPPCDQVRALDEYFGNQVRHQPEFGQSVLTMPSGSTPEIQPGLYRVEVSSFRPDDMRGTAVPRVTAVVQLGSRVAVTLDLHFFFLDLDDHPCAAMMNHATLDAGAAQTAQFFQIDYLGELRGIIAGAGLTLAPPTYDDIREHPELDGLDVASAGELQRLGKFATGINVFFVRSLSPAGLQAFGPNPGPAGLGGTRQSGIVIGLDTLCYRSWPVLARLTAHELARYMGLYHNVEPATAQHPTWRDQISDSDDSPDNLMYFSERGDPSAGSQLSAGFQLSDGQRQILIRSAVLR